MHLIKGPLPASGLKSKLLQFGSGMTFCYILQFHLLQYVRINKEYFKILLNSVFFYFKVQHLNKSKYL